MSLDVSPRRSAAALGAIALCLALAAPARAATPGASRRWLVVFKSDRVPSDAAAQIAKAGGRAQRAIGAVGVVVASGDAAFAATLAKSASVAAVGPEHVNALPDTDAIALDDGVAGTEAGPTAADNLYFFQWDMRRIGAPAVWARLPLAGTATVAVLDTGVMDTHPDLAGQVVASRATTYCNTAAHGSDAYPIYSTLIDFDAHPSWSPEDGCTPATTTFESHGTHVAGTIAARFGGGRVVGVDPDARIAAYKVFDRFRFTDDSGVVTDSVGAFDGPLFAAIVDATDRRIPVISMSLGSLILRSSKDDNASWLAWNRVVKYADRGGTVVVSSAGNSEFNLNGQVAHVPSDLSTVVNVSASGWSELTRDASGTFVPAPGSHDVLAFYSDFGAAVDLTAPGGDCGPGFPATCVAQYLILSSVIDPREVGADVAGYAFFAGTSMATPHVSAVAAMVRALHPSWTPGDVRSFLKTTAQPLGDRQAFGHGMVDADAATR